MVIDSNIIIYGANAGGTAIINYLTGKFVLCSQISLLETLGCNKITEQEKININQLLTLAVIASINDEIIATVVELRQSKKMSLGGSIIAATAIYYDYPLFTNNKKDFLGLSNLQVIPLSSVI